jgi:hypothetical protein
VTVAFRPYERNCQERLESLVFTNRVKTQFYKFVALLDLEGRRPRRSYIQGSFCLIVFIYALLLSQHEGALTHEFITQLEKILNEKTQRWGEALIEMFQLLLLGQNIESIEFRFLLERFHDECMYLDGESWQHLSKGLLSFLLHNPVCGGKLQDMWKERLAKCNIA